jgi:hypothetical protein
MVVRRGAWSLNETFQSFGQAGSSRIFSPCCHFVTVFETQSLGSIQINDKVFDRKLGSGSRHGKK